MERLTKWEGHDPDGTPRAVLAKRDGNWNDNIQAALRKLAQREDMDEILEPYAKAYADYERSICVDLQEMHDRAESDWMRSVYQQIKENEIPVHKEDDP